MVTLLIAGCDFSGEEKETSNENIIKSGFETTRSVVNSLENPEIIDFCTDSK